MKVNKYLSLFFLALPVFIVFRAIFQPGTMVSGDAPFLFPEGFKDFFNFPQTWNEWVGALGSLDMGVWLYPLDLLYGYVGSQLGNDLAIRLVFIIPSILFSLLCAYSFARFLKIPNLATFFVALLYTFNTYFLLLLDGGQVGVALSYSIFPLTLLWLKKLLDKLDLNTFYICLVVFNIHLHTDIRVAAISLLVAIVWKTFELIEERKRPNKRTIFSLALLVVTSSLLNSYWLYPLLFLNSSQLSTGVASLQLTSLLNSITLFQPHWPANEFGKVSPPPFYFIVLPAIWITGQVLNPTRKYLAIVLTLLIFAFLAKGTTPPLGFFYEFFLERVPLASIFRDSTKFFIPIILFTGVLVGQTVEYFSTYKNKLLPKALPLGVYAYLLFLIYPAFTGQLQGALSVKPLEKDYQTVANNISSENNSFRTAWFPQKPPFAYFTNNSPALDARELVNKRPLASLNTGTHDRFNFLTSSLANEWLELFNIKYLFFKPDTKLLEDEEQRKEWDTLIKRVDENSEISKVNWGTNFPVYELKNTKPRIFGVEKAVFVVGSEDVYEKLQEKDPNFDLAKNAFFFLESGQFNPDILDKISPELATILFNEKTELDLKLSLLERYLISTNESQNSEWAMRESGDYLGWKYELLVKGGISTKEFDFQKGISFSTIAGERIEFNLPTDPGEKILVIRQIDAQNTPALNIYFNGQNLQTTNSANTGFEWKTYEVKSKDENSLVIENPGGFHAVNAIALIPKSDWAWADDKKEELLSKFKNSTIEALALGGKQIALDHSIKEPSKIEVNVEKPGWIIFSSTYDKNWEGSLPAYSALNAWYVDKPGDLTIEYRGQKLLKDGLKVSLATLALLLAAYFGLKFRKK